MNRTILAILLLLTTGRILSQTPSLDWINTCGSKNIDNSRDLVIDNLGNTYSIGNYTDTLDVDPGPGVVNLISKASDDAFVVKYNNLGQFVWAISIGGKGIEEFSSIALDNSGNFYVTALFSDTADFDPSISTFNLATYSPSVQNVAVAKYNSNGQLIWAFPLSSNGGINRGADIVVDAVGDVYVAGQTTGIVDFDPSVNTYTIWGGVTPNIFLAKYSSSGSLYWASKLPSVAASYVNDLTIDLSGEFIVTGSFQSTIDLDPSLSTASTFTAVSSTSDVFLAKYNSSGQYIWGFKVGATGNDEGFGVCTDSYGNIYTCGVFFGNTDFDPSANVSNLTASFSDGYLAKYNSAGNYLWAIKLGGSTIDNIRGVAIDLAGNVLVTGQFSGTVDFDPSTTNVNLTSNGNRDAFLGMYNKNGQYVWAFSFGGLQEELPNACSTDNFGGAYVCGFYSSNTDFDPSVNVVNQTAVGISDAFTGKYITCTSVPNQPVSIIGSSVTCANSSTGYSITPVPSATGYLWSLPFGWMGSSNSNTINVIPNTPGTITVTALNGCGASTPQFLNVNVNAQPSLTLTASSSSVCIGTSSDLFALGASTYTWSTGANTSSINVIPLTSTIYTLIGASASGCTSSGTISLSVNSTCSDVWPGDANSDGVVNTLDVFELGLNYLNTGSARSITSNSWIPYFANNWLGSTSTSKNMAHSDCNGDGVVDVQDTLAIYNNYSYVHSFKLSTSSSSTLDVNLYPDQFSVPAGAWGSASIYLGDTINSLSNLYGVAYDLVFDTTLIYNDSIYIRYVPSFLNASSANIEFKKTVFNNSVIHTASVRTNSMNVNGYGKIATLYFKVKNLVPVNALLNFTIMNGKMTNSAGTVSALTSGSASVIVNPLSTNIKKFHTDNIKVYPNPNSGEFIVQIDQNKTMSVSLFNFVGQKIYSKDLNYGINIIKPNTLAKGTYFFIIFSNNEPIQSGKILISE